jgi:hypothetical protein
MKVPALDTPDAECGHRRDDHLAPMGGSRPVDTVHKAYDYDVSSKEKFRKERKPVDGGDQARESTWKFE